MYYIKRRYAKLLPFPEMCDGNSQMHIERSSTQIWEQFVSLFVSFCLPLCIYESIYVATHINLNADGLSVRFSESVTCLSICTYRVVCLFASMHYASLSACLRVCMYVYMSVSLSSVFISLCYVCSVCFSFCMSVCQVDSVAYLSESVYMFIGVNARLSVRLFNRTSVCWSILVSVSWLVSMIVFLSVGKSVIYVPPCVCLSMWIYVLYMSVNVTVLCLSVFCLFVCWSVCLPVSLTSASQFVRLSVYLNVCMFVWMSVSLYVSVCLHVCLPARVHSCLYVSVYESLSFYLVIR